MADYPDPDSRKPDWITSRLKEQGLSGQHVGLHRVCSKTGFPESVWSGDLGQPLETQKREVNGSSIIVEKYDLSWVDLIQRLTFGVFCLILDIHLPSSASRFWTPHLTRNLGFLPADRNSKRFFHYLELSPHIDHSAWDPRSIPTRVHVDLQRDFADAFARGEDRGGSLSLGARPFWPEHYYDRLSHLRAAVEGLRALLTAPETHEAAVHQYLERFPILIDVYGRVESRPRFIYPEGQSPLGKEYVEPDFIVHYPGRSYLIVEIERPSKKIMTRQGQPRAETTQATFQITEWRTYIQKHYHIIADRYPGIAVRCRSMVILGRDTLEQFGGPANLELAKEHLHNTFKVDEIITYDDLLVRAMEAYVRLSSIAGGAR